MAEYIEREAALEAVKKEREYAGKFSFEEERAWTAGFLQGVSFALSDIVAVPAADVQPVRHGRWLWRSFNIMCSECDFMPYFDSTEPLYPYCPNCGAKMDGDVNGGTDNR